MTERTYDVEDPKDLPYRFAYSPITDEVFIIGVGHGFGVLGFFENRFAFHRFLSEGIKMDDSLQNDTLKEATEILRVKQAGVGNETTSNNGK